MEFVLSPKAIFLLNQLNNRVRQLGIRPQRLTSDSGIDHLLRYASKSNDLKTKALFRKFLLCIEDENTIRHISSLIPKEDLKTAIGF